MVSAPKTMYNHRDSDPWKTSLLHTSTLLLLVVSGSQPPRFCAEVLVFCWGLVTLHLFSQYLCLIISSGKEWSKWWKCKKQIQIVEWLLTSQKTSTIQKCHMFELFKNANCQQLVHIHEMTYWWHPWLVCFFLDHVFFFSFDMNWFASRGRTQRSLIAERLVMEICTDFQLFLT